jgi:phage baseplate assembly protein W
VNARSDFYVQSNKQTEIFSDFLDDFAAHPLTGDIARVRNEQAIKQSVRNLVLTTYGERFFQPQIGSNVNSALFEFNDSITASDLDYHIRQTLENNESRVNVQQVNVKMLTDNYSIAVSIIFTIINTTNLQTIDIFLKRVR